MLAISPSAPYLTAELPQPTKHKARLVVGVCVKTQTKKITGGHSEKNRVAGRLFRSVIIHGLRFKLVHGETRCRLRAVRRGPCGSQIRAFALAALKY
jgi:hypothetical protein